LLGAAKESIPKRGGSFRKKIVPRWTQECTKVIKERHKAFKILKRTHNFQNLVDYKRKQAVVRKTIERVKKIFWGKYCESLGRSTPLDGV